MKSFLLSQIILILVCTFPGCAFKEASQPPPTQEPPKKPEAPPIIKKRGFVSISGSKEKGTPFGEYKREYEVVQTETTINIPSPMTLPEKIPQEFALKVASTAWKDKLLGKVIIRVKPTLDNGVGTELTASDVSTLADAENQTVAWTMNIAGLDKVMPPGEESARYVQVELYEKGKSDATEIITFPVITPPSKLGAGQMTASSFEKTRGTVNLSELKTILSTNFRLDLIQVLQISNSSTLPVIIREPIKIAGNLNSHYRKVSVNQRMCGYDAPVNEWIDELATDFFLLPLNKEVADDPVTFINRKLKTTFWEQRLEPGEEKLIGIYAQGAGVVKLVSGTYPMQKLQSTQVVKNCKSRCFNPNQVSFGGYWATKGWPGASRTCLEAIVCAVAAPPPSSKEAICNECMEWDLQANPWNDYRDVPREEPPGRLFCVWKAPNRGWQVEKFYETIKTGTENDDVILRLPVESTIVHARYDLQVPNEISQERAISGLIQTVSIQQNK